MKLQIKDDTGKTHSVPLTRDEITIGRKEGNTIRLTERNVSRTHARFLKKGEEIHVEDLSRYGTRVNGERITETRRVGSGDVIQIGDYMISLEGVKPVDVEATADAKLAAAGAAAQAGAPKGAPAAAAAKADGKDAKGKVDEKAKKEPTIPPGYAMKTMPDGAISADEIRKSLGAGKKRIGANNPTLVAVTTHLAGQEFPLNGTTLVLGRTGENDIKVDHQSISSNHAKIVISDGRVKMVDLKSKNGIRVNGEYWEESTLKSGDIVELGKVQFRFVEKGEEFIYRPEDYVGGAVKPGAGAKSATADAATSEKKGSKAWIVILLLLLAGGAVAVFLATKGPSTPQGGGVDATVAPTTAPPTTAATNTATAAPTQVAEKDATTAPPTPDTTEPTKTAEPDTAQAPPDQNAVAKAELFKKANEAVKAQKWDDAKAQLDALMALDATHAEGKALLVKVEAERAAGAAFDEVQAAQAKNDLPAAWTALQKLANLPQDSVYYARVQEVKNALGPALANSLVDQAKAAYARKQWNETIAKCEEAKKIVFNHAEADELIAKARKKIREDGNKPPDVKPPDVKPPDVKPPDGAKTGAELYKAARDIHNSDPNGALALYQQAAGKGYAVAWKQIGSIKVKLGDTAGAIAAYKRYLSLVPSANDADMVKDIIVRLGGTP